MRVWLHNESKNAILHRGNCDNSIGQWMPNRLPPERIYPKGIADFESESNGAGIKGFADYAVEVPGVGVIGVITVSWVNPVLGTNDLYCRVLELKNPDYLLRLRVDNEHPEGNHAGGHAYVSVARIVMDPSSDGLVASLAHAEES
jgi:hypothetical protein